MKPTTQLTFEKPVILKFYQKVEIVVALLAVKEYLTKEEIAVALGWEYPKKDRQIRLLMEEIRHLHPIISTSDTNKGYRLAKREEDISLVKHAWAEIDSRIGQLNKNKKPLLQFLKKYNANITLFD